MQCWWSSFWWWWLFKSKFLLDGSWSNANWRKCLFLWHPFTCSFTYYTKTLANDFPGSNNSKNNEKGQYQELQCSRSQNLDHSRNHWFDCSSSLMSRPSPTLSSEKPFRINTPTTTKRYATIELFIGKQKCRSKFHAKKGQGNLKDMFTTRKPISSPIAITLSHQCL